jgi:hypothetical protein
MEIVKIILQILGYWIGLGISISLLMYLCLKFAEIVGDMAERLKAAVC